VGVVSIKIESHEDLRVWQDSIELVKMIYNMSTNMPEEEKYGLISQIQRSVVSVPSNIAEGFARDSLKEYIRYLSIAAGSLAEMQTQVLIAHELGFVSTQDFSNIRELGNKTGRQLTKLRQSLKEKLT